ncbi:MAG: T9SS type A sorting domain-containing protein [Candidatus Marinimicrobia bacterium]|nr:T9SS type A sorting domain-containing protein [Candidatus Neomarinimicrobiota bacterium]
MPGFVIQSASGAWNGVSAYLNDTTSYTPVMGDEITVTGTVDEDWAAYSFQFSNNTVIRDISVVVVTGSGMTIAATTVSGADLLADPESYEGVLVTIDSVAVTSLNSFDWSVSDGTGEFLIDDDWLATDSPPDTMINGLAVGDVILGLSGIYNHSFGTIKVQIRDLEDLGVELGVDRLADLPTVFSLSQNYPNPFNPATTINYTLPRQTKHTLKVYNLLGAEVATLVSDTKPAGAYSITWNAQRFASGLYFIRLEAGDYNNVKKMILLK